MKTIAQVSAAATIEGIRSAISVHPKAWTPSAAVHQYSGGTWTIGPGIKRGNIMLPASTSRTAPDSQTPSSRVKGAVGASARRKAKAAANATIASAKRRRRLTRTG